jgi:hypothetical protein
MNTEEQIKELTCGLSVGEIVCLIKDTRRIYVRTMKPINDNTLADLILSYLLDGFTAIPF